MILLRETKEETKMNSILRPKARTARKARTLGSWFWISLISAFLFVVLCCLVQVWTFRYTHLPFKEPSYKNANESIVSESILNRKRPDGRSVISIKKGLHHYHDMPLKWLKKWRKIVQRLLDNLRQNGTINILTLMVMLRNKSKE